MERAKRFKSSKEGIFAKIAEIESVCGVISLTVIVNCEKELCCYSGDPQLISDFFTRGVARNHMSVGWNVRQFDCEEVNPFESTVYNNSISRITMYILGGVQCLLRPSMCCVSKHAGECNTLSQIVLDLHHTDFQGKWRQAALELFQFPPSLPLSLHPCPPAQV